MAVTQNKEDHSAKCSDIVDPTRECHLLTFVGCVQFSARMSFVHDVPPMDTDKINRPSLMRRAIWIDLGYLSTSKASPNDSGIVIVIIVVGEAVRVLHDECII
jgi:hypothetical protein